MRPMSQSLEQQAASLIIAGMQADHVDADAQALVAKHQVGGIILFRRNIHSPEQVHGLIRGLKTQRHSPLLMAVDQEGGRVARLRKPFFEMPPMRLVGRSGDVELARAVGRQLGAQVRSVGFDFDFAPVVDVDTNPKNPVIGDRSFSEQPDLVSAFGAALAQGLKDAGVLSCAKHFPGHGDTLLDSHHDLPSLPHDLERLRRVEWPPFVALEKAGVDSVMTAHVVFDALDQGVPATLSKKCLDLLRHELGFSRAIVSDDLEMKAIADRYSVPDAAVQAVAAGCDVLLVCHTYSLVVETIEALCRAKAGGAISNDRWAQATANAQALIQRAHPATERYVPPSPPEPKLQAWLAQISASAGLDPTEAVQRSA